MSLASSAKNHFELIISFVAVAIAIAAVVVAFYETRLMREQASLSVKPSVWLETNSSTSNQDDETDSEFEFIIKNRGLGPASLEYFTVRREGKYIRFWQEWLSNVPLEGDDEKSIRGISHTSVPQKYVLPNGDELQVISIRAPSDLIRRISSASDQYEFTICACSFYNECWISQGLNAVPQVINECKVDPESQFQGQRKEHMGSE
jgi:hypothetical protein